MSAKEWPFPGDAPVVRARKIALAYRTLAENRQRSAGELKLLLDSVSKVLLFDDRKRAAQIKKLLAELTGDQIGELDRRFLDWGEQWHTPLEATYTEDDEVPTAIAAKLIQIAPATLTHLRSRGRVQGKWKKGPNTGWTFRVGDLYKLQSEMRSRTWKTKSGTDSVSDGSSAPT